tara:strand:+ start:9602 stop:9877 length:276 start_codon:yes stop_codon:yes gene_type:complete
VEHANANRVKTAIVVVSVAGFLAGLAFYVAGKTELASIIWFIGVVPALATLLIDIPRSVAQGDAGRRRRARNRVNTVSVNQSLSSYPLATL